MGGGVDVFQNWGIWVVLGLFFFGSFFFLDFL